MKNRNCLIVQSGGPTAVINNSMIGVIDEALESGFTGKIYGSIGGIYGLIHNSLIEMSTLSPTDRLHLRRTPGSALGTWRHKIVSNDFDKIIQTLRKNDIGFLAYIGGNGSMNAAQIINQAAIDSGYDLSVIGIPKSIDNDLMKTDHSPGFGSAAKFLASSILELKKDVESYPENNRVTIIETMGRHSGWLAAACSLTVHSKNDDQTLIYIPEIPFQLENCLDKVLRAYNEKRNTFIIVAEGITNSNGHLINEHDVKYDFLGRPKLGGVSSYLKNEIETKVGIKTRAIEPSIWQRSSTLLSSATDAHEAYILGQRAWKYIIKGYSGKMVTMKRIINEDDVYQIAYGKTDLKNVAGIERKLPKEWYNDIDNSMTADFTSYVKPLIHGEIFPLMENGLPVFKKII